MGVTPKPQTRFHANKAAIHVQRLLSKAVYGQVPREGNLGGNVTKFEPRKALNPTPQTRFHANKAAIHVQELLSRPPWSYSGARSRSMGPPKGRCVPLCGSNPETPNQVPREQSGDPRERAPFKRAPPRWPRGARFLENATVRGRDWYQLLDAPVLTLDVTGSTRTKRQST